MLFGPAIHLPFSELTFTNISTETSPKVSTFYHFCLSLNICLQYNLLDLLEREKELNASCGVLDGELVSIIYQQTNICSVFGSRLVEDSRKLK